MDQHDLKRQQLSSRKSFTRTQFNYAVARADKFEQDRAALIAVLEWLNGATETYLEGTAVARMNNLTAALREARATLAKVRA